MCWLICKVTVGFWTFFVVALFVFPAPKRLSVDDLSTCLDESAVIGKVHVGIDRDFDIVIHGATGFTGKLAAKYLAKHPQRSSYAIAGRSKDKLDALAISIKTDGGRAPDEIIVADSADSAALLAMAKRAKVVLAAAGPYAQYGSELLKACAAVGTHYADMSGETFWQRRMLDTVHDEGVKSGSKLVLAAGFDSVPFDLGVQLVLNQLDQQIGQRANNVSITVAMLKGGGAMSGGTLASGMGQMEELWSGKVAKDWNDEPYLLSPQATCRVDSEVTGWGPFPRWESTIGAFAIPHIMGPINARIVRRSLELIGRRGVSYAECMTFGALADAIRFSLPFVLSGVINLMPKPGEGPAEVVQMAGSYEGMFVAIDGQGNRAELVMKGRGDPGYRHTSKLFTEVGLCLADVSCHRSNSGGGILTSMSALDRDLLEKRLMDAKHEDGKPLLTYTHVEHSKGEL